MRALTAFQREVIDYLNSIRRCEEITLDDLADELGTSPQKAGQAAIRILATGRRLPVNILYANGSEVGSRAVRNRGRGRTPTYTIIQTVRRGRKKIAEKVVKLRDQKVIESRSFQRKDAIAILLGDGYGKNILVEFKD